ncbi:hypothetical protein J6590_001172 [Homalodisca vitripennis]|nr:hypothetical protein J6590_001172 [Homalodisca vitripennis]
MKCPASLWSPDSVSLNCGKSATEAVEPAGVGEGVSDTVSHGIGRGCIWALSIRGPEYDTDRNSVVAVGGVACVG